MASDNKENISTEEINRFKVPQLKDFLRSHNQNVGGNLSELKTRAKGVLALKLPNDELLKLNDTRDREQRNLSKFISPLGEQLPSPNILKSGWTKDVSEIPDLTEKDLYNYLVYNSCRTTDGEIMGAKKQLKARVFYEDNHVHTVEFNNINNDISHGYVRCRVIPSMPSSNQSKDPDYTTWICLSKTTSQIHSAECSCPAGEGEACNHVAALLWCLVDVTIRKGDGTLASTSAECKWNQPRKRKLSPKKAENIHFRKAMKSGSFKSFDYQIFSPAPGKTRPDFDALKFRQDMAVILPNSGFHTLFPRPPIPENIISQCCLPEPNVCFMSNINSDSVFAQEQMSAYLEKCVFDSAKVEELTRGQRNNHLWEMSRKGRVTASNFGQILKCSKVTAAVKTVMGYYMFVSSDALEWGKKREKTALAAYAKEMKSRCKREVNISESGLLIHEKHPFIGASPDGIVTVGEEIGLVEIKCPFKFRNSTPAQAAEDKTFCCEKLSDSSLRLKRDHRYYFQVQGQMGLKNCAWCDFVIWTTKDISIERIQFDNELWQSMLVRLVDFYHKNILPEVFSCKIKKSGYI